MSVLSIHLWKLLQLMYADRSLLISKLRADIRDDLKREKGSGSDGGDFHNAFWSDAKKHVLGEADLRDSVNIRIDKHKGRARLYPDLRDGFLLWWEEKRRWRNEPLHLLQSPPHARMEISALNAKVKVESMLAVGSQPDFQRLVYPYFSEKPALSIEAVRVGLWTLHEALPKTYELSELRILDLLRGQSYALEDVGFDGDESQLFLRRYGAVIELWNELKKEY